MDAESILTRSAQVERIDTVARHTFGSDNLAAGSGAVNPNVLSGGRAIVQASQKKSSPSEKLWPELFPELARRRESL